MNRRDPLATAALVVACVAGLVAVVSAPVSLVLQLNGGLALSATVFVTAVVIVVLAGVALGLGIAAARRRLATATAGVALGIAGFLLIGQIAGVLAVVVAST